MYEAAKEQTVEIKKEKGFPPFLTVFEQKK